MKNKSIEMQKNDLEAILDFLGESESKEIRKKLEKNNGDIDSEIEKMVDKALEEKQKRLEKELEDLDKMGVELEEMKADLGEFKNTMEEVVEDDLERAKEVVGMFEDVMNEEEMASKKSEEDEAMQNIKDSLNRK